MKRSAAHSRSEARGAWLFMAPSLCGLCIFVLIPFAETVRRSFCNALGTSWKGLDNYRSVLQNRRFAWQPPTPPALWPSVCRCCWR